MQLFKFRGGVHPKENKEPTSDCPIEKLPLPDKLYVPMLQHIGSPAKPCVRIGQKVLKGELIGEPAAGLSAPIHAPTSGTVIAVDDVTAPHPSGLPALCVVIEPDGDDKWCDTIVPLDPFKMEPEYIATRVGNAGIVGMGGAAFPSSVKLNLGLSKNIHTLIINGGECEPYLTADDRLMREKSDEVIDGIRIMLYALDAEIAYVAIENNKPEAQEAMRAASADYPEINIVGVPTRYPMGSEKQMIQTVTGKEVPAGKLSAEIGMLVHNVATAAAVHQALRHGHPLVSRVVTVSGKAIKRPTNLEVPIGTLASDLIKFCGGVTEEPARLLMGGPMMGTALPHMDIPIVKGTNGILALNRSEVELAERTHQCIRCTRCVGVCPLGLVPLEMAAHIRSGKVDSAVDFGLNDCIACGTCTYVCPSNIPLTQYFNYAKGELAAKREAAKKSEYTKALAQARTERLEREKREKKEKMAKRKREMEAKKRAEAAKKAAQESE